MSTILPTPNNSIPPPDQVQSLVSFLEHEPQPMIVLDPDYNILAANTAYRRQFGSADQPFIGHKCYRISHHYDVPCDQAGENCPMKKAREMRGPDRVLHIHHTPRGPEHVDVELRPILNDHGDITAYVERLTLVRSASARPSNEGLVGSSPAFNRALSELQRVAPSMLPVLLLGESGTGKELFARAVHETSERANGPFVVVDCSGLTETLFESELFGHEKGAFTGATLRKQGLVETAQGGTLFLDEIGDVPLAMQVKLLRLIESGTYRRVGGVETLHADFRLVAATHKPLEQMMAQGEFRQDLYYRISVFPIHLPPLRNRMEDIALLVNSLLQRSGTGKRRLTIDADALMQLQRYSWPGNIRELRNVLERASLFADDGVIHSVHLPQVPDATAQRLANPAVADGHSLAQILSAFKGTRSELARHLGISERTLYRRLKEQGLA
ncbi:sigma 54-interacting transcriptional regulator [Pseudomonas sp. FP1154]|jgi:transcriptional regulator with PAS, ATPase and Fis domain|uniref:Fis family transcriptional regulator n=1 Tax=Pseudomonas rhizophila TaxID=2045200 RepID=A0ABM6UIV1_9PSED|nr:MULTISPECIES: sigma 54-interacting transcriptional regulator [Pseudomonas]AVU77481.1 Fis family transcriptional regulator [Pseudomonas rhizophila]MBD0701545.1 Fis family transcriptional regulator [Pseudomonas sp. PSB1]MDR8384490.1 sigma 54-interacting transcriptional regulator [Pseudomonas sp. JL2]MEA1027565.1 sigma 54-interacting transcriptional regulator [Pseudomonas sp. N-137]MXR29986.1 PAS domain-containing protein [Pseudomonas sp. PICF6]